MLIAGAGIGAVGAVVIGGVATGVSIGGFGWGLSQLGRRIIFGSPRAIVARVPLDDGLVIPVRRKQLDRLAVRGGATPADWALCVPRGGEAAEPVELRGEAAQRAAAMLLPAINRFGATSSQVSHAVQVLESADSPLGVFALTVRQQDHALVAKLPPAVRIALEMAAHEERERRAFEGELAALEREWREAEEIAAIADNLLVPTHIEQALTRMHEPTPTPQ